MCDEYFVQCQNILEVIRAVGKRCLHWGMHKEKCVKYELKQQGMLESEDANQFWPLIHRELNVKSDYMRTDGFSMMSHKELETSPDVSQKL